MLLATQKPFLSTGTVLRCPELIEVEEPENTTDLAIKCTRSLDTLVLSIATVVSQDGTAKGWYAVIIVNIYAVFYSHQLPRTIHLLVVLLS